jgi:hypothetical protein
VTYLFDQQFEAPWGGQIGEEAIMRRLWRKPRCGCWVIIVLISIVCYALIGFSINFPPKSPLQQLEEARALWEAKGSDNYRMDISLGSMSLLGRFQIVVHNNQVVDVSEFAPLSLQLTPTPLAPEDEIPLGNNTRFSKMLFPTFAEFTMDNLFNNAAHELEFASTPPIIAFCLSDIRMSPNLKNITFDQQFGYIKRLDLGDCPSWNFGLGFMCSGLSHCGAGISIRSLELLPPT